MLAKFEHTQNLSKITFNKTISVFCPLGNDYYTATINIDFVPSTVLMDYLDEEAYFKGLSGTKLIIEDLVKEVYDHYFYEYEPAQLTVTVYAENATHFPVAVTKTTDTKTLRG